LREESVTDALASADQRWTALLDQRNLADDERNLLRRQLAGVEEAERKRLSRELHDQLGQHLAAIIIGLHEIAGLLPSDSVALERLRSLQELTQLLTRDARYLAIELRPPELDDVDLESAMASYIELWMKRYGIEASFQSGSFDNTRRVDDATSMIYRVLQEALTNVAKHSNARHVSVLLGHTASELLLVVEDDGDGFDIEKINHHETGELRLGIAGMKERAALVDGVMSIESTFGAGTTVFVRVPSS
jgi:signal transduction histidine kinase